MKFAFCFVLLLFVESLEATTLFRNMISELALPEACKHELESFYLSGKSLANTEIQKILIPLKSFREKKNLPRSRFYHYTDTDLSSATPATIFEYLKKNDLEYYFAPKMRTPLYVANDAFSSKTYGNHVLVIDLKDTAKVITLEHFNRFAHTRPNNELPSCNPNDLRFIMLEDSGVELIEYAQMTTSYTKWFMLLNDRSITKFKYYRWGRLQRIKTLHMKNAWANFLDKES